MSLFSGVRIKAMGITIQNFVHLWMFVLHLVFPQSSDWTCVCHHGAPGALSS